MPERYQLRCTAGYREPAGAVVPDRVAAARHEQHLASHPEPVERSGAGPARRDLTCSCPLDDGRPCHAEVVPRVANT